MPLDVAIITARGGSKSIANKNVMPIGGLPLVAYPIMAALASRVDEVYVSTDCPLIADVARGFGVEVIDRPANLRGDEVNHGDVIRDAVERVANQRPSLANVVVLLGNTVMIDAPLIDRSLDMLDADASLDSVMSVWEAADDHPYRAMSMDADGCLIGAVAGASTNRQSYPRKYFYDQGVWTFRRDCVRHASGPSPWWWMGPRCKAIVREWVTGRDIHSPLDATVAEWWLARGGAA
jgi:CMP-N,N'-diacetyllegionaminic acid synthase